MLELEVVIGTVKSPWVRFKGQTNKADIIVGLFHRALSWDGDTDELFFKELRESSKSTILVLVGDFNLPSVNWDHYKASKNRFRRFLKHLDDNFMVQVLRELLGKMPSLI